MDQIRTAAQPARRACPERYRRDGWTAQRQLAFLDTLARTRSVTSAARVAGMSRESAYRLRRRDPHGLFAAAWARLFPPRFARTAPPAKWTKVTTPLSPGQALARQVASAAGRTTVQPVNFGQPRRPAAARRTGPPPV